MKRGAWVMPMAGWALNDLRHHPFYTVCLFSTLAALTALLAVQLIMAQALIQTSDRLMQAAPSIVVRRISAGGWMPIPVNEALACVQGMAGVLNPRCRIWGIAQSANTVYTIVGLSEEHGARLPAQVRPPSRGHGILGPGVRVADGAGELTLSGVGTKSVRIAGRLPDASGMATHDVILLHADDARAILGLSADHASDLALDVFREEEVAALRIDLAEAFPWPVHLSTREEEARAGRSAIIQRSGVGAASMLPALMALFAMVAAVGLWGVREKSGMGLLKALGWTGGDILKLHFLRAALIGFPALLCGFAVAVMFLFRPGTTWIARLMFDWNGPAPALALTLAGSAGPLLVCVLLVGLPFSCAVFWAGWQGVRAQPADLLQDE